MNPLTIGLILTTAIMAVTFLTGALRFADAVAGSQEHRAGGYQAIVGFVGTVLSVVLLVALK